MIYHATPFATDKNLGKAYNDYVKLLTNKLDDWIFFRDSDCMFLTSDWGKHIQDIVEANPESGIITCLTNRVNNKKQCYGGKISDDPNIINHYDIAKDLHDNNYWDIEEIPRVISGMMFGFSRKTWEDVEGFFEIPNTIVGVDTRFSFKISTFGKKIICMNGLYVTHYYRMHEQNPSQSNSHLI